MHQTTTQPSAPALAPRRFDAGRVRVSDRDIAGLMLCGEMYGAPYDLLAGYLCVQPDRLRGIVARWRAAGYAETGRLGPGPAWCWLTRPGLAALGLRFAAGRPSLGRLEHLRAVLAVRIALESSPGGQAGQPWWRSERRIRAAVGGRVGGGHIPDAETCWPEIAASPYPGERWAIEVELTPKPLARTTTIMAGLLHRHTGYSPGAVRHDKPRSDRAVYLFSPPARSVVTRAAAALPAPIRGRVTVRDLPPDVLSW
ncbi:MAG: hypothetical protein ACR2MP_20490 [Streptosporangiaceae bacterium]